MLDGCSFEKFHSIYMVKKSVESSWSKFMVILPNILPTKVNTDLQFSSWKYSWRESEGQTQLEARRDFTHFKP